MADLSGYPVVRLDQICLLNDSQLTEIAHEVKDMIKSLTAESDITPPLVFYLRRQLTAMEKETTKRSSPKSLQLEDQTQHVESISSKRHSESSFLRKLQSQTTPRVEASDTPPLTIHEDTVQKAVKNPPVVFVPLPLPSELSRLQRDNYVAPLTSDVPKVFSSDSSSSLANKSQNRLKVTPLTTSDLHSNIGSSVGRVGRSPVVKLSSRSASDYSGQHNSDHAMDRLSDSDTMSISSHSMGSRRRPLSAAQPPVHKPTQLELNKQFGENRFVVAATEKKIRFYPKKIVTEDPEEVRARQQAERRNLAMKRLMERREERSQLHLKANEAKRKEKLARQEAPTNSAPGIGGISETKKRSASVTSVAGAEQEEESSGSESVSGGEDDVGVTVDPQLVLNLQQGEAVQQLQEIMTARRAEANKTESSDAVVMVGHISETFSKSAATKTTVNVDEDRPSHKTSGDIATTAKVAGLRGKRVRSNEPAVTDKNNSTTGSATKSTADVHHSARVHRHRAEDKEVAKPSTRITPEERQLLQSIQSVHSKHGRAAHAAEATTVVSSKAADGSSEEIGSSSPLNGNAKVKVAPAKRRVASSVPSSNVNGKNVASETTASNLSDKTVDIQNCCDDVDRGVGTSVLKGSRSLLDVSCDAPRGSKESPASQLTSVTCTAIPTDEIEKDQLQSEQEASPVVEVLREDTAAKSLSALQSLRALKAKKDQLRAAKELSTFPERFSEDAISGISASCSDDVNPAVDGVASGLSRSDLHPDMSTPSLATAAESFADEGAVWQIDMGIYKSVMAQRHNENHPLFRQRSLAKREVSQGLLMLALHCESLLLGTLSVDSETAFKAAWTDSMAQFDLKAEQISNQDGQFLFENVSVCGNCHAVCKKLENLLRTYFVRSRQPVGSAEEVDISDDFEETVETDRHLGKSSDKAVSMTPASPVTSHSQRSKKQYLRETEDFSDSIDSTQAGILQSPRVSPRQTAQSQQNDTHIPKHENLRHSPPTVPSKTPSLFVTAENKANTTVAVQKHSVAAPTNSTAVLNHDAEEGEMPGAVSVLLRNSGAQDEEDVASGIYRMTVRAISTVDEAIALHGESCNNRTNDGDSDGSDDDGSIVPMYSHNKAVDSSTLSLDDIAARDTVASDIRKLKMMGAIKTNQAVISSVQSGGPTALLGAVASVKVSLTDCYPHIGLIFPVAYSQMSSARAANDDGLSARALIESMTVQARVYTEWMEVMADYSTVFSDEKGAAMRDETYCASATADDNDGSSTIYKGGSRSLHYRVKSVRSEVCNIVSDVFNNQLPNWEELPAGLGLGVSWNVLWTWSKPRINMSHLLIWQRVNHFQDSKQLTRKDLLKKNLQRYTDLSNTTMANPLKQRSHTSSTSSVGPNIDFEITPQTFVLPHEYTAFVSTFTAIEAVKSEQGLQNYWIVKPIGLSRGRGISLLKDLSELSYSQATVVQRYVENPLCLSGYKFDLRLYVLVTSFKPLEAFIYRDGFARVSTHAYSLDPESMNNKFIHLTNSSIQKLNAEGPTKDNPLRARGPVTATGSGSGYSGNKKRPQSEGGATAEEESEDYDDFDNDAGGSKIGLLGANGLWKRLEAFGVDIEELWRSICSLVVKSLVVVDEKIAHQPCCFELFGYDVLIDSDLRPWLLEVNASPSLARENQLDFKVKDGVVRDIIPLIDPAPFDRAAVVRVLKRRLNNLAKNRYTMGRNDPDLERDLKEILGNHIPRRYGEVPGSLGGYEMLCPGTKIHAQVLKMKKRIIKS